MSLGAGGDFKAFSEDAAAAWVAGDAGVVGAEAGVLGMVVPAGVIVGGEGAAGALGAGA